MHQRFGTLVICDKGVDPIVLGELILESLH